MSNFKTKNMDNRIVERLCRFYEMPKEVYDKKRESQPKRMLFYILQNKLGYTINDIVKLTKEQYRDWETDRKSTRLNSSHSAKSRMPSSA